MDRKAKLERKILKLQKKLKEADFIYSIRCDRIFSESVKHLALYEAGMGCNFSRDYCAAERAMYDAEVEVVRIQRLLAHTARKLGLKSGYAFPSYPLPIFVAEEWKKND